MGRKRKTEKDYHDLAKTRGFKWVGAVSLKNTLIPTLWECEKGDRWVTAYSNIKQGNGCPVCSGKARKVEKDYHELAKSRGFKWVGVVLPKSNKDSTWWECEKGDRWKARYHDIQQGGGCPACKDMVNGQPVSKPQRKLNNLLCGILNYPEGRYRIDVAIIRNNQKVAVEYDAQYWHQGNEERDSRRDNYLIFRGWKILHVKSSEMLPTRKQLKCSINNLLKKDNNIINLYLEDWRE